MSIYNALYGRDGHGVGPNEPEKKGFARFCQMVGRDLGQLLGTNLPLQFPPKGSYLSTVKDFRFQPYTFWRSRISSGYVLCLFLPHI